MNTILPTGTEDRNVLPPQQHLQQQQQQQQHHHHHQQQQNHDQSVDGLSANAAMFMNLNNSILKQQQQHQQQQTQRVNPTFNALNPQDFLGKSQQLPLNPVGLQPNSHFAASLEPNMTVNAHGQQQPSMAPAPPSSLSTSDQKRKMSSSNAETDNSKSVKKFRTDESLATPADSSPAVNMTLKLGEDESNSPPPVEASEEGIEFFRDNDVLSGRGGGTNVHPGNRNFRDLINLHRRSYLKARKNDKPAISRAIVRAIRESGGRFLKKKEKSNLWFEIGDDAAREKTSQALRQRAPEMRKLLFDTEREARAVAEEQLRQQRQRMLMVGIDPTQVSSMMATGQECDPSSNGMMNPALFQAMAANTKLANGQDGNPTGNQPFSNMFSAALLQNGINRFASNGA